MDPSNFLPNMSNVLTVDTLKVAGGLLALWFLKVAVWKFWAFCKTAAAQTSYIGLLSAILLLGGSGGIGMGIGKCARWQHAVNPNTSYAIAESVPHSSVTEGSTAIGLGVGAIVVGASAAMRKWIS